MLYDRFLDLLRRISSLSAPEASELDELAREDAATRFSTCPVCGGAISGVLLLQQQLSCPNCAIQLSTFVTDIASHRIEDTGLFGESDASLGVLTTWLLPVNCVGCSCGLTYPNNYTVCPNILAIVCKELQNKDMHRRDCFTRYVDQHAETLLNCLRGRFHYLFDRPTRRMLISSMERLNRGTEIAHALKQSRA